MTNKDILEQICHDCPNRGDCGFRSRGLTDKCQRIDATEYALEVKDQQFKEYLEKNRTNYPDFMSGEDSYAFGMKEGFVKAFDKIINELFKED